MSDTQPERPSLVGETELEKSGVVANSRMNRERALSGVNSYEKELGINPLALIREQLERFGRTSWLDLCCGSGKALIEAAERLAQDRDRVVLHGVDLVNAFHATAAGAPVRFEVVPLHRWEPTGRFGLITCVHGLHYIGDKLGLIERCARWLAPEGVLFAHLDLANLRGESGEPLGRALPAELRRCGFAYQRRRHRLSRNGASDCKFRFRYLGADDHAGANYTGQEAVHSVYRFESDRN